MEITSFSGLWKGGLLLLWAERQGVPPRADIAGKKGDPIRAALKGTVVFSGWKNGIYGNTVIIQHDHDLMTLYAHNSRNLVQKGDRVHAGRVIAELGSTGRATGPHLHWEVHLGGKPVNPKLYVK